jgi:hypothetical protein
MLALTQQANTGVSLPLQGTSVTWFDATCNLTHGLAWHHCDI